MTDREINTNFLEFVEFALDHAGEGVAVADENGRFIYVNDAQCKTLGYSREKLLSMSVSDIDPSVTPENWPSIREKIREAGSSSLIVKAEHRTRNGGFCPVELSIKYVVFNGNKCFVAIVRDITTRKQVEDALRESEDRLRLISESSAEIIYQLDLGGHITYISPAVEKIYGYTPEEILNFDHTPFFQESEYGRVTEAINKTLQGENFQLLEFISKKKDNSFFPVEVSFTPTIKDGAVIGVQGVTRDITERKQVENALRNSEVLWQFALEGAGDGVWDMNFVTKKVYYSSRWKSMLGYSDEEIDNTMDVWEALLHPDDKEAVTTKIERYLYGETPVFQSEHRLRCKNGSYKWILARGKVIEETEDGKPLRVIGTHTDISESKQLIARLQENEKKLQESNELFSKIFYNSPMGIAITNAKDWKLVEINEKLSLISGYDREKSIGHTITELGFWPSEKKREQLVHSLKKNGAIKNEEIEFCKASGELRFGQISTELINYKGEVCTITVIHDITDQKKAEEEKKQLEARFRQLRKLEAIATLAGGIAHQFNNALSVITGNLDLLELNFPDDKDIALYSNKMKESAIRMTELTKQLLSYSRGGKYVVQKISLSNFLKDMLPSIKHKADPDVHVDTYLADDVFNIDADPAQLNMVLSAILANAIEAVGDEGRIMIDCRNERITEKVAKRFLGFKAGIYACMTITDDGKGMDEETKNRIFEPFFTTKFQGRGLGMAAAYGIVKNHDGYIMVDSELVKGTTVKVFLPVTSPAEELGMPYKTD